MKTHHEGRTLNTLKHRACGTKVKWEQSFGNIIITEFEKLVIVLKGERTRAQQIPESSSSTYKKRTKIEALCLLRQIVTRCQLVELLFLFKRNSK